MATAAISGVEFWHNTEFGKALAKVLPPQLTRVIIDIPVDGEVKIYYASVNTGPIVDLKWDGIIEQLEVVKPQDAGCDMAVMQGGKGTCSFGQTLKAEQQYLCARCGFRTEDMQVMNTHSAGCKVPLNSYGG